MYQEWQLEIWLNDLPSNQSKDNGASNPEWERCNSRVNIFPQLLL